MTFTKVKAFRQRIADALLPLMQSGVVKEIFTCKASGLDAQEHLPALQVYFDDGDIEGDLSRSKINSPLKIEILLRDSFDIDDKLDDIGAQVEPIIAELPLPDGCFLALQAFGYLRDPDSALGALILTYDCKF